MITPDDNDVWVASELSDNVTRFANNLAVRKYVSLEVVGQIPPDGPTGIALDSRGNVWTTCQFSHDARRINPSGGIDGLGAADLRVPLGDGAFPYNYSDMTGMNLLHTTAPAGVWSVVYDSAVTSASWNTLCWSEQPGAGKVIVRARAANVVTSLGSQVYVAFQNGVPLTTPITGRYLQVRVQLNSQCHNPSKPLLLNLNICRGDTLVSAVPPSGLVDARQPHPVSNNSHNMRQGIGSPNTYTGGPEPIVVTFSPAVSTFPAPCCWGLCETGIEEVESGWQQVGPLSANFVETVDTSSAGVFRVFLDRPISAGFWTRLTYLPTATVLWYASLPADANKSLGSNAQDITALQNYLSDTDCPNGPVCTGPPPCQPSTPGCCCAPHGLYSMDMNHSGAANAQDVTALINLLNGASAYITWNGKMIPAQPSCGGAGMMAGGRGDEGAGDDYAALFIEAILNELTADRFDEFSDKDVTEFIEAVLTWCANHFTDGERADFAAYLSEPKLEFATDRGAKAAAELANMLSQ